MFTSPSPILITIFGFNIYYYGIILAVAIATGVLAADYFGSKYFMLKKETIVDLSPFLILFGIIGARIYYCLLNYEFFFNFPTEIFALRHGGISIHGALIGGLISLGFYSKIKNISFLKLTDTIALALPLAQSVGRWGNFFNSEAFGLPTNLPWKLYIAEQYRPIPFQNVEFFHPTFLYESILNIVIFLIFLFSAKYLTKLKAGNITLIYLILYSLVRIFTESLRLDSVSFIFGQPVALVVSVGIIFLSLILLFYNNFILTRKM